MKKSCLAIMLACIVITSALSQVQVRKTDPSSISTILPFYSQGLLNASNSVNFAFTRPPVQQGSGVPTNLSLDTSYDNLDDTTYETNPIFDLGRVINSNLTIANGNWQSTSFGNIWCLKISIDNALNNSLQFSSLNLSPTANLYILNGDVSMVKGPFVAFSLFGLS
jgi:hypothetical protein